MKQYRAVYEPDPEKLMFYLEWSDKHNDMLFVSEDDPECFYPIGIVFHDTDWIVEEGIGIQGSANKEIFQGDIEKGYEGETRIFCWHFNRWVLRTENGRKEEINKMWAKHRKYNIIGTIHDKEIK